jgi:hypothetical protein
MAHADVRRRRAIADLREAFERYETRTLPKLGHLVVDARDADVDLFEEDAYLAGLVSSVLAGRPMRVESILLDRTIDSRLAQLAELHNHRVVADMLAYRMAMRRLAALLSAATGVPTRD